MSIEVREFVEADYDAVIALWKEAEGVLLRDADRRAPLCAYLAQNRGLSFVALRESDVVGAVLCGTDGRRGYLQHLAVAMAHRREGIGRRLAEASLSALTARGIDKCHLFVVLDNDAAHSFWLRLGWLDRTDVRFMSHTASGTPTA